VALLLPGVGSVTPAGAAILAVFPIVPVAPIATVALTVNVTLPPDGSVGMTMPAPCINATVVFGAAGHAAPPLALPQLTPVMFRFVAAGSVNTAPSADDETIRLTPLALHEMRLQFTGAGVEVPLLPQSPAQTSAAQLLALADGVSDDEFEADSAAWLAARDPQQAATELLDVAASGDPEDRLLAVAVVSDLGAAAEPAWRDRLGTLELRPYAKVALVQLGGLTGKDALPAELEADSDDLAWMATDLLAIVCDDEDTDADEISEAFAEALPPDGDPAAFLDLISRGRHPDALDVLEHIGEYHPDKAIAKEARKVAYKATMREAARQRASSGSGSGEGTARP